MAGKNRQIHLFLETELFEKLTKEAKKLGINRSELVRRKIVNSALPEEILILRKLRELIKNVKS